MTQETARCLTLFLPDPEAWELKEGTGILPTSATCRAKSGAREVSYLLQVGYLPGGGLSHGGFRVVVGRSQIRSFWNSS